MLTKIVNKKLVNTVVQANGSDRRARSWCCAEVPHCSLFLRSLVFSGSGLMIRGVSRGGGQPGLASRATRLDAADVLRYE